MTKKDNPSIAPLKNVALCARLLERAQERREHLPGMVVIYGPAGFGKTCAADYCAIHYDAAYIRCKSSWTRKAVLQAIAEALLIGADGTISQLTDRVSARLALTGKPLIIDEMDHLADRGLVEVIRDIYDGSLVATLLIGEEKLPSKLAAWERFHSRILEFVPAQPADADDVRILIDFYAPNVTIEPDLFSALVAASSGSLRRVCVNLAQIEETALGGGRKVIDLAGFKALKGQFWTGVTEQRKF